ncbi:MAG: TadE/TadG family type IV pilus assembly protein [Alphaproteobacteria bacterium]
MVRQLLQSCLKKKSLNAVRRWARDAVGATVIIYGVIAVPILGFVGAAVDYSRLHSGRVELQNALDAAALAAGRAYENTIGTAEVRTAAAINAGNNFFAANFPDGFQEISAPVLAITVTESDVNVTADADMPTQFMQVLGVSKMDVQAETTVVRNGRGVELVLVMDNTGSMRGKLSGASVNKMDTMIAAAHTLVDTLYNDRETIENFYVSLVPYAAMVNIGSGRTGWVNSFSESTLFAGTTWKGCVMGRADPYDETDDPPGIAKWDVMAWPSTKDQIFLDKNGDELEVTEEEELIYMKGDNEWPPIDESNSAQNDGTGPNLGCPPAITPLIQSKTDVKAAINEMQPWHRGGTMSNLGLVWGWRVISPRWRGLWGGNTPAEFPLDYAEPNWEKVVIMLTDGTNQWYDWPGTGKADDGRTKLTGLPGKACCSSHSSAEVKKNDIPDGADYTAYGRIEEERLGSGSFSAVQGILDDKMEDVCQDMRDAGVIIFTITFGVNDNATKTTFENCAGRPDQYFNSPTNNDLQAAFVAIATEINNLRISE